MEPLPAPPESPGKREDNEVSPGSLSRFATLAARLFAVEPARFKKALAEDEQARRKKRVDKSSSLPAGEASGGASGRP
jgi:hypothetical protein